MTRRDVVWEAAMWPGIEHLRLTVTVAGVDADGLIVMARDAPLRLRYEIRCDASWACRELRVASLLEPIRPLELRGDGRGRWIRANGEHVSSLDGCLDVDIAATPFTNTLPIRRLGLAPGRSADITVVYVDVPDLSLRAARQRYTCLEQADRGGRWRYENPVSGFTAELAVDSDGLVLDYPDIWRRVWPG